VTSPEFWKRPERVTASNDPDTATAQTIGIMCSHVKKSAADALVQETARSAARQFSGLAGVGPGALASAAWYWCKTFVKFVHHESILRQRLGEAGHLQGLISPEVLVRMDRPEGDCAIFSECVCAFLRVLGVPYELVTVAVNPNEPDVFSHVYVYAVLPNGERLPLDASHGDYPGWQVPSSDVFKRQVWDQDGNPVADRGSRFDGLHNYALRGLGQEGSIDLSTLYPDVGEYGGWDPAAAGTPTAPAGTGFNWGSLIGNLANQWTQIGGRVIAPTTTFQRDSRGNIIYQTPGAAPAPGSIGGGGSSWLLIAGVGAAALLLVSSMGKGR